MAVFGGLGAAIIGTAVVFPSQFAACVILWKVFACPTASTSWSDALWVAVANSVWMTAYGLTVGLWQAVWQELRMGRRGTFPRIGAVLGFVLCVIAIEHVVGLVFEQVRPEYVIFLHRVFGIILGFLGLLEPLQAGLAKRLAYIVALSAVTGLSMAWLLHTDGRTMDIVLVNGALFTACGLGILSGSHVGIHLGLRRWGRRNLLPTGGEGRALGLAVRAGWRGVWCASIATVLMLGGIAAMPVSTPQWLRILAVIALFEASSLLAFGASYQVIWERGTRWGRLRVIESVGAVASAMVALNTLMFGLAYIGSESLAFPWAHLLLFGCLPLYVAWCLWWSCESIWREGIPATQ